VTLHRLVVIAVKTVHAQTEIGAVPWTPSRPAIDWFCRALWS
jgi:hypothetical protein